MRLLNKMYILLYFMSLRYFSEALWSKLIFKLIKFLLIKNLIFMEMEKLECNKVSRFISPNRNENYKVIMNNSQIQRKENFWK